MCEIANPWTALTTSLPYVLEADQSSIERFNLSASSKYWIHTELLPEPYFGRRDAPVVLLALNPGFSELDAETHLRPDFLAACRRNLAHNTSSYPFVYLDPKFDDTPGGAWWLSKLTPILDEGVDQGVLARNLLCIEWFPYHSREFGPWRSVLSSQRYGFSLVEEAIRRDALIIDMRSSNQWSKSIAALALHRRRLALNNPRNPTMSRRNYPGDFAMLVDLLRAE